MAKVCKCGGIIRDEGCSKCGNRSTMSDCRQTANARGYDYKWQKFTEQYKARFPLCVDCEKQGKTEPAVDIHHIKKLRGNPKLKYELTNLMGLCKECHAVRTARGE